MEQDCRANDPTSPSFEFSTKSSARCGRLCVMRFFAAAPGFPAATPAQAAPDERTGCRSILRPLRRPPVLRCPNAHHRLRTRQARTSREGKARAAEAMRLFVNLRETDQDPCRQILSNRVAHTILSTA